jgi:hypothetical protein
VKSKELMYGLKEINNEIQAEKERIKAEYVKILLHNTKKGAD